MFYDRAKIYLKAGDGGSGMVSFRREKYVPEGGPNGGDGGKGADIYLVGDENLTTMVDFKYKKHYKADRGEHGKSSNMHGRKAKDLFISVPIGTIIKDEETGLILADVTEHGQKVLVAKGGRGGRGNARFMTNKLKAPRIAENGDLGVEKWLLLELKIMADVGIAGYPNAGKSTLINVVSNAKSKIGAYPFTTLEPHLGVVEVGDESFVLADIPGLIDGASEGVGLGHEFLKHLERTRVIIHILDGSDEEVDLEKAYDSINNELKIFNPVLGAKKQIIVINKIDLPGVTEKADAFIEKIRERGIDDPVFKISALTHVGLKPMLYEVLEWVKTEKKTIFTNETHRVITLEVKEITVIIDDEGVFEVHGEEVDKALHRAYLASEEGLMRFDRALKSLGVSQKLLEKGIKAGDTVRINGYEMEYID